MKPVKCWLPEETISLLEEQAEYAGLTRAELIRQRLTTPPNSFGISTADFHKAVTKIRRRYSYGLDRQQAESIVAAVISELFNQSQNDPNRELSVLPGQ